MTAYTIFYVSFCIKFQHSSDFNLLLILRKKVLWCEVMRRRRRPNFLSEGPSSIMTTQNFSCFLEPLWLYHSLWCFRRPGGHNWCPWRATVISLLWLGRAARLPPTVNALGEWSATHRRAGWSHLGALHRSICQQTVAIASSSFLAVFLLYSQAAPVHLETGGVVDQIQHLRHEGRAEVNIERREGVWACPCESVMVW